MPAQVVVCIQLMRQAWVHYARHYTEQYNTVHCSITQLLCYVTYSRPLTKKQSVVQSVQAQRNCGPIGAVLVGVTLAMILQVVEDGRQVLSGRLTLSGTALCALATLVGS